MIEEEGEGHMRKNALYTYFSWICIQLAIASYCVCE